MSSDSTSWVRYGAFGSIIIVINGRAKRVYVSERG